MCNNEIRDGATTKTIPENQSDCVDGNCNEDYQYGMHESYSHYLQCLTRARNEHLYTADQVITIFTFHMSITQKTFIKCPIRHKLIIF